MVSQEVGNAPNPSFRRRPESSKFKYFWIPDQVRDDSYETSYGFIKRRFGIWSIDAPQKAPFPGNCEFRNSGIANYAHQLGTLYIGRMMSFSIYCEAIKH